MSSTYIPISIRRQLWFNAHGRCELAGCNKRLDINGITMDKCDISNYAHIIGDSPNGPRGNKVLSKALAKDVSNLILLCPECHKLVDNEGEQKYSVDILRAMKKEHEDRIWRVTGINPEKKSLVVAYGPKIGKDTPYFNKDVLFNTIFPDNYPVDPEPVEIQMNNSVMHDGEPEYWRAEVRQIEHKCLEKVFTRLNDGIASSISLFPLGPQPLLVKLGTVLNDKYKVTVFQKHRIPDTWRWLDEESNNDIKLIEPTDKTKCPVLVIALSSNAIRERIIQRIGESSSIWCITCDTPGNDMMRKRSQLEEFNRVARMTMDAIKSAHPDSCNLSIYMAAPASCAVELGRIRMAKADMPWILYDYRNDKDEDVETITIS